MNRRKLKLVYAALVIVPLVLIAVLGGVVLITQQDVSRAKSRASMVRRLEVLAALVSSELDETGKEVLSRLPDSTTATSDSSSFQSLARTIPFALQPFVADASGALRLPEGLTANQRERDFLERTRSIWTGEAIVYRPPQPETSQSRGAEAISWLSWHWQEGIHLLAFRREVSGAIVGAELDRIAVLSRLVAALQRSPDLVDDGLPWRISLVDARGDPLAQYGSYEPKHTPVAEINLKHPLDAWKLRGFEDPGPLGGWLLFIGLASSFVSLIAVSALLALWLWREQTRDLREAEQRVGFVTRVSHELKTPLTNIRLYAEMVEDELSDDDEVVKRRLKVIVGESQRLSRLIHNILTFSRKGSGNLRLRLSRVELGGIVEKVIESCRASLEDRGLEVIFVRSQAPAWADSDAVEQIVMNLVSNAEKYAASGKRVEFKTGILNEFAFVEVRDFGPGVSAEFREAIFEPFFRISDALTDEAGTGIGLTISRDIARAQHGDLSLRPEETGVTFVLTLPQGAPE